MADAETKENPHLHAFTVKRANGDIEIRAAHPDRLKEEMDKHAVEHKFEDPTKYHDTLHGVIGSKK